MTFHLTFMDAVRSEARPLWPELTGDLDDIPPTTCLGRAACCALLPQMTLLEASRIADAIDGLDEAVRRGVWKKLIEYFHLNAVRIMGCPFLEDGRCSVYDLRPFGCRAYGLWSVKAYGRQTRASAEAQGHVAKAWEGLGVRLPREVIRHRPTYCRSVITADGSVVDDDRLESVNRRVRVLDDRLGAASAEFSKVWFNDLGFLAAAEMSGIDNALKNKVSVTREFLERGSSPSLDYLTGKLD